MLLPGLARTTQGSQDYQAARSLSVRTRGSFRSTRYGNLRRAALVRYGGGRAHAGRDCQPGRRAVTSADDKRVKTALDETRLLILGAQILFGFHLNAAFQRGFGELSALSKDLYVGSFAVMAVTIALLIAPSLQHRLVEQGRASARLLAVTTRFAAMALLLFALGLATDLYVVIAYRFGVATGLVIGPCFGLLAVMLWYGTARLLKRSQMETPPMQEHHTPLDVRIEQMLTEARVLIPGAQALFGFQLAVMLTDAFGELAASAKVVHVIALCCIVLAVILLMAPAAFHRIAYGGENTEAFYQLGSCLIVVAALPLALGITLDLYVAATRAFETRLPAILTALGIGLGQRRAYLEILSAL
jgi:hypothetical protein